MSLIDYDPQEIVSHLTAEQQRDIAKYTVGLFQWAPGGFMPDLAAYVVAGNSTTDMALLLAGSPAFKAQGFAYSDASTNAQFADAWVSNLFGDTLDADLNQLLVDIMADELIPQDGRAATVVMIIDALDEIGHDDPDFGAAAARFDQWVDNALNYTLTGGDSTDSGVLRAEVTGEEVVEGQTIRLTEGTDLLDGTSASDTFVAGLVQSPYSGGVTNSLSSADVLDGKGGYNILKAILVEEFRGASGEQDVISMPTTKRIQEISLEAREDVVIDAKKMVDVEKIGSSYSDGNLTITNLTTETSAGGVRNTEAMTIFMDHTANQNSVGGPSDLTVYFDNNYLLSGETSEYTLELRIVNAYQLAENNDPLVGFLSVEFTAGSEVIQADISGADTYAEVVAAIQQALTDAGVSGVTVSAQPDRNAVFTDDIGGYTQGQLAGTYNPVLLTSNTVELTRGRIELDSNVEDFDGLNTWISDATTDDQPVTVNIELHKVGRGSEGGDLKVGGKSTSDSSEGIPIFRVQVLGDEDKPSNLGTLSTTNGSLEKVYITSEDRGLGATYADLTIRDGFDQDSLDLVDASGFQGDLTLAGVSNLETLIGNGAGSTELTATIDANGTYSYSNSTDDVTVTLGAASARFNLNTGAGNDTVTATFDGNAIDTIGDFFTITSMSGNNDITVTMNNPGGVSLPTMRVLNAAQDNYLTINTGTGDDEITVNGIALFDISSGSGDDFIVINTGGDTGTWDFGQDTGAQNFGERVLYKAELTLSFAGFEETVTVETGANFVATQANINAAIIEAIDNNTQLSNLLDYELGTGNQQLTVTSLVNGQNSLAVALYQPELVAAGAGAGQVVLAGSDITALRQGLINTTAWDSSDLGDNTTDVATFLTAFDQRGAYNNFYGSIDRDGQGDGTVYEFINHDTVIGGSGDALGDATTNDIFDVAGADGTLYQAYSPGGADAAPAAGEASYAIINAGRGDDTVVLSSHEASSNVLKIDGQFDQLSVVNFHNVVTNEVTDNVNDTYTAVGNHRLEFTFLDNQVDESAANSNSQSVVDQSVTVNVVDGAEAFGDSDTNPFVTNTNDAVANSVNLIRFQQDVSDPTDLQTFAGLDAATLVAALNDPDEDGSTDYGNLEDDLLSAVANQNLTTNTQKHIIMVENDLNEGEYKVFEVTSTLEGAVGSKTIVAGGNFTNANLIGTIDFGASVNLKVAGNVRVDNYVAALMAAVENNDATFSYDPGDGTADVTVDNPGYKEDVPDPVDPAEARLTTGVDELTGTDADDIFDATLDAGANTLTAGDVIDGGDGTDRINIELVADAAGFEISNIENFWVRDLGANDRTINMQLVTGAQQLWNDRAPIAGDNLTFDNVQNAVTIGLNDVRGSAAGDTVTIVNYDTDADVTSQAIVANGVRNEQVHTVDVGFAALTAASINTTAASSIHLGIGFNGVENLTLTGDSRLTLSHGDNLAFIETVDGGSMSGDVDLDIRGQETGDGLNSVVLGGGDNKLTISNAQLIAAATGLTINLGGGTNELVVAGVDNDTDVGALAFTGDNLSVAGVNKLTLADAIALGDDAALTLNDGDGNGIDPSALVFESTVNSDTNATNRLLTLEEFSGDSITFEGAVGGANDRQISVTAAGIEGALSITTEDAAAFGTLTFAEATSLSISAEAALTADSIAAAEITSLTVDTGEAGNVDLGDLTGTVELTTITAEGAADLELNFDDETAGEKLATVNATALEGKLTADLSDITHENGIDITMGSGDADITLNDTASAAGKATIVFGADSGEVDITQFTTGHDQLDLKAINASFTEANVTLGAGGDGATAALDSANGKILGFTVGTLGTANQGFANTAAELIDLFADGDSGNGNDSFQANAEFIVITGNDADGATGNLNIWHVQNDGDQIIQEGEITLIGTLTDITAIGDIAAVDFA